MEFIIIILLAIYFISKGMCDKIRYNPAKVLDNFEFIKALWFKEWLLAKGDYQPKNRSWLLKYPFSFLSDGWHWFDSLRTLSVILIVIILLPLYWYFIFIIWILGGLLFELIYNL